MTYHPTPDPNAQDIWYLSNASGSDSNDGKTLATALKTGRGLGYRLGAKPYLSRNLDIYINGDMDPADTLVVSGYLDPNGSLSYHGIPTPIHSGVLSAVTAYNIATNQADEVSDGVLDWTPYVGMLIVIQTGAVNGPSYAWIAKALAGPNRARLSLLGQHDPTQLYIFENIGPAAIGDAYTIYKLPILSNLIFDVSYTTNHLSAEGLSVTAELLQFPPFMSPCELFASSECVWSFPFSTLPPITMVNPLITGYALPESLSITTVLGLMLNATIRNNGHWSSYGTMMQASQVLYNDLSNHPSVAAFETHHGAFGQPVFDCLDPFVIEQGGSLLLESDIWGSGNTGTTFVLTRGGRVLMDAGIALYVTNSGADLSIDGYVSLPAVDPVTFVATAPRVLTFANFFATVAAGGFGKAVFNPRFPATGMISN